MRVSNDGLGTFHARSWSLLPLDVMRPLYLVSYRLLLIGHHIGLYPLRILVFVLSSIFGSCATIGFVLAVSVFITRKPQSLVPPRMR
jgi:hypothetical protein